MANLKTLGLTVYNSEHVHLLYSLLNSTAILDELLVARTSADSARGAPIPSLIGNLAPNLSKLALLKVRSFELLPYKLLKLRHRRLASSSFGPNLESSPDLLFSAMRTTPTLVSIELQIDPRWAPEIVLTFLRSANPALRTSTWGFRRWTHSAVTTVKEAANVAWIELVLRLD